jgi:fibronectin type 3 domain-containing protein/photosystem II stability/assembly factor-like uncharacterized protein
MVKNTTVGLFHVKLFLLCSLVTLITLVGFVTLASGPSRGGVHLSGKPDIASTNFELNYRKAPLQFEINHGQFNEEVRFFVRGSVYNLFLTTHEIILVSHPTPPSDKNRFTREKSEPGRERPEWKGQIESSVIRIRFVGVNQESQLRGLEEKTSRVNYLYGSNPSKWHYGVPTYARVRYEAIYPGIDLVFYGNDGHLEYDIVVSPGGDPELVQLELEGADKIELDSSGDLVLSTASGEIRMGKPQIYQEFEGERWTIPGGFRLINFTGDPNSLNVPKQIGFHISAYNREKVLIIDPVVNYSVYLGGTQTDLSDGIAVDSSGYIYVIGATASADFPVKNPIHLLNNSGLFKSLDGGGNWELLMSGPQNNFLALTLDPSDPKTIYAGSYGGGILKSKDAGETWTSMNSGLTSPEVSALAIDPLNTATIYAGTKGGGVFKSTDGGASWVSVNNGLSTLTINNLVVDPLTPTTLYLIEQGINSNQTKLYKSENAALSWTYVDFFDFYIHFLAIDPIQPTTIYVGSGCLYKSTDGGTTWKCLSSGLPSYPNQCNPVSLAIDPTAPNIIYMGCQWGIFKSINGGEEWSQIWGVVGTLNAVKALAIDPKTPTNVYALNKNDVLLKSSDGGGTWSVINEGIKNRNLTTIAIDPINPTTLYVGTSSSGKYDIFVAKLDPKDLSTICSTYLGGSEADWGRAIAVDSKGYVYITGYTESIDFPVTEGAFQTAMGVGLPYIYVPVQRDAIVAKLNAVDLSLYFSTYLGGADMEEGTGIAVDDNGNAYVTGWTQSYDFPVTAGAFDTNFHGIQFRYADVFVTKVNSTGKFLDYSTYIGGTDSLIAGWDKGMDIKVDQFGQAFVTGYTNSVDFPTTEDAFQRERADSNSIEPNWDAFLVQLNADGSSLVYSTYLGLAYTNIAYSNEFGMALALDTYGNAIVIGKRVLDDPPITFIGKLSGGTFEYFAKLQDLHVPINATGVVIDSFGNIFITGYLGYWELGGDTSDAFLVRIDRMGNIEIDAFGGSELDGAWGIAIDSNHNIYLTGGTASNDFPLGYGGIPSSYSGLVDTFVVKLNIPDTSPPSPPTNVQASDGAYMDKVRITWTASSWEALYTIYRATSIRGTKTTLGATSDTIYDDTTATVGTTYYYWATTTNAYGESGFSAYDTGYRSDGKPSMPTNVQASDGIYLDKVEVTWTASLEATYYTIYRATSLSRRASKTTLGTTSDTFFNDTSAVPLTTYYYCVKASNAYGTSDFSAYDAGYRSDGSPAPPTNISASDGTYMDKVEVTWTASTMATSYTVYRATSLSRQAGKTILGSTSELYFYDTTAVPKTTYYYYIKASNAYGTSDFSAYDAGYRSDGSPPIPTNVAASDGTYVDRVEVTWAASLGATSYTVYRATSTNRWAKKTTLGTTTETFFNDTTASVGVTYYYYVTASNSYGTSSYSTYDTGHR